MATTTEQVNMEATKANASEWFINEEWGQAVGRFGKKVVNFEKYSQGWYIEEVSEWSGQKTAAKDFAREVRAIEKANS